MWVSLKLNYTCDLARLRMFQLLSQYCHLASAENLSFPSERFLISSGFTARTPTLKRACLRLISIAGVQLLLFTSTFLHAVLNVWSVHPWKVPERRQHSCVFVCMLCLHVCSSSGCREAGGGWERACRGEKNHAAGPMQEAATNLCRMEWFCQEWVCQLGLRGCRELDEWSRRGNGIDRKKKGQCKYLNQQKRKSIFKVFFPFLFSPLFLLFLLSSLTPAVSHLLAEIRGLHTCQPYRLEAAFLG